MKYQFNHLIELLNERANERADKIAYRFLADGEHESVRLTYADIFGQAKAIANILIENNIPPGARALVLYPPGVDYIGVFFGCMMAGVLPVPAYPAKNLPSLEYIEKIARSCAPDILFTHENIYQSMQFFSQNLPLLSTIKAINTDTHPAQHLTANDFPARKIQTIAFLQFTSGSTGNPKGVMVTHGNLLAYAQSFHEFFGATPEDIGVSWLPQYHDMGLIGVILQTLFEGGQSVLMPPSAFLSKPARWLQAITQYRATHSVGPNFAFDLCAQQVTEDIKQTLDLSSWKVAYNGSEPIHPATLQRFAKAFADAGFKAAAMTPGYGLAEATLIVTSNPPQQLPVIKNFAAEALKNLQAMPATEKTQDKNAIVSCGLPLPGQTVKIVNPDTFTECGEGIIGEIWINSPTVALGYWQQEAINQTTFQARLADTADERTYLRTGDLGFMYQGELYFSSRLKDLIIIHGKNYYPQDLELVAQEASTALQEHCIVVFEHEAATKKGVVIVAELKFSQQAVNYEDVCERVRNAVSTHYAIPVLAIVLVHPGGISKTTSGKVQRRACQEQFLNGRLRVAHSWQAYENSAAKNISAEKINSDDAAAALDIQAWVIGWLSEHLAVKPETIDVNKNFIYYGLDSVQIAELINELNALTKTEIAFELAFDQPSIAAFCGQVQNRQATTGTAVIEKPHNLVEAVAPAQARMWIIQPFLPRPYDYHLPLVMQIKGKLNTVSLQQALQILLQEQLALRSAFLQNDNDLSLQLSAASPFTLKSTDISAAGDAQAILADKITTLFETPFDLSAYPLWRIELFKLDKENHALIACFHHMISDFQSLEIFINRLNEIYNALEKGERLQPEAFSIDYTNYAYAQRKLQTPEFIAEQQTFWRDYLSGYESTCLSANSETSGAIAQLAMECEPAVYQALQALAQKEETTLFNVLLACFMRALAKLLNKNDITIGTAYAHRNHAAYKNLIGFFSELAPVRIKYSANDTLGALFKQTQQQVAKALSHPLSAEHISKALAANEAGLQKLVNILFNFIHVNDLKSHGGGQWTHLPAPIPLLDLQLVVFTIVSNQTLMMRFNYDAAQVDANTVEALRRQFKTELLASVGLAEAKTIDAQQKPSENLGATIYIASSFTAEPLNEILQAWLNLFELNASVHFAPYNQILPELLNPNSDFRQNRHGFNIILYRAVDSLRFLPKEKLASKETCLAHLEKTQQELLNALEHALASTTVPTFFILPAYDETPYLYLQPALNKLNAAFLHALENIKLLYVIKEDYIAHYYPVNDLFDKNGEEIGHVPYAQDYFTALATTIMRTINAVTQKPYKVIACDCDNTLWQGVCAEDGALNVKINPANRALQQFLLEQKALGRLICLISKNQLDDVKTVFQQHPDMLLKWEDITAAEVNWQPKSQNLQKIADMLELGLDSFIVLDDNRVEIAEMQAACPTVLAMPFIQELAAANKLIAHLWAFDQLRVTEEDKQRTQMYQQQVQRKQYEQNSSSFADFIRGLELKTILQPVSDEQLPRVAQLTQRTNQFNTTTKRRSEAEIKQLLQDGFNVLTIQASDRFGDYGLIGAAIYGFTDNALKVDDILLSCRVLGKGIEHHLLATLAAYALENDKSTVSIDYAATKRNQPALNFLAAIAEVPAASVTEKYSFNFAAATLKTLTFAATAASAAADAGAQEKSGASVVANNKQAALLSEIAQTLNSVAAISQAFNQDKKARPQLETTFVAPESDTEKLIADLWRSVLKVEKIGVHDDFIALGGNSLLAIQLFFKLQKAFNLRFNLAHIARLNTVAKQAQFILHKANPPVNEVAINFADEAQLDDSIRPAAEFNMDGLLHPRHIFITGTTGFLGIYLLAELIRHTQATLHCLVRAENAAEGLRRIIQNAEKYNIAIDLHRIEIVAGDLNEAYLGLDEKRYLQLAEKVDLILHSAAQVNFTMTYAQLKKTNVKALEGLLRFAGLHHNKALHYISTIAVFDSLAMQEISSISEFTPLPCGDSVCGGYAQTKWVSEKIINIARTRGFVINIYRPSAITGNSVTGQNAENDAWGRILANFLQQKTLPNLPTQFDVIPVDYCAAMVRTLALDIKHLNQNFHLTLPERLSLEKGIKIFQENGIAVKRVSFEDWKNTLLAEAQQNPEHLLYPLLPLFFAKVSDDLSLFEMLLYRPAFATTFTYACLENKLPGFKSIGELANIYLKEMLS